MILYLVFVSSYLLFSSYCFFIDVINNTDTESKNINLEKYDKAIKPVLLNIFGVSYIFFSLSEQIHNPRDFKLFLSIRDIILSTYIGQLLFYIIHRIFHKYYAIQHFHRIHHEFKEPIGIRAAYTHPIDFFFGNMIPIGITPFLLNTDIYTTCFFIVYSVYGTIVIEHSNHDKYNKHHINHHRYFNCNYGAKWIDNFMGTSYKD